MYHNNIVGTIKIHLCPSHIGQVIRLPGSVSLDVLRIASLQVTLAVLEVVDTENWVNSTLSCFDPSSIVKMQSYSLASDRRLLLLLLLYMYVHTHILTCIHVCTYTYTYMYTCMYIHIYLHVYMYVQYTYTYMYTCMYIHIYLHVYMH